MSGCLGRRLEQAPRLLVALAMVCLVALPAFAQRGHWIQFHDPRSGLSFSYPPDLHVRRRDPRNFHLPNVEMIVDLTGNTRLNPGVTVLRFIVKRGISSAREAAKRRAELRRVCAKTSSLSVGGHEAVVCTSRGRAAVHWSVEILQPRQCTILALLGGADYKQSLPPPHDGDFPLLSIIRTVRFTSSMHTSAR